tara:strand:+ start:545 stop:691 length:147 start_codon:yes stop_codon:yes gene_type:complete
VAVLVVVGTVEEHREPEQMAAEMAATLRVLDAPQEPRILVAVAVETTA